MEWYQKAAAQGSPAAQFNLGLIAIIHQDYGKALDWLQKAAEQEFAPAQVSLGMLYLMGEGLPRDVQKGCALISSVAKHKDKNAIGLYNEYCTQQSQSPAVIQPTPELLKAAEQGDAHAQYTLGFVYANGQDDLKAIEWYTKAANQGIANAQFNLGLMYVKGQGVPADKQKGCNLMYTAIEKASAGALEIYKEFCGQQ
jgi:TPR repeat protein